jgi:hypothetical protein
MPDIFNFHKDVVENFELFSRSFTTIRAKDIEDKVNAEYADKRYWPAPLIQINPNYKKASAIVDLVKDNILHPVCGKVFQDFQLYTHQQEALALAQKKEDINFAAKPRYWVDKNEVLEKIARDDDTKPENGDEEKPVPKWLMGWRGITNATNERTLITSIVPFSAIGNSTTVAVFRENQSAILLSLLYANLNSFALDFAAR